MGPDQLLVRMIETFCRQRAAAELSDDEVEDLCRYCQRLIEERQLPPRTGTKFDWRSIAFAAGVDPERFGAVAKRLTYGFDALAREIPRLPEREFLPPQIPEAHSTATGAKRTSKRVEKASEAGPRKRALRRQVRTRQRKDGRRKPGPTPRPVVEFPEPQPDDWEDPVEFHASLQLHMRRHGDSAWHLHKAIAKPRDAFDRRTILAWARGENLPASVDSLEMLRRIEHRYRLPAGYFQAKLLGRKRSVSGHRRLRDISASERRRMAWHLPDDFDRRPEEERNEIVDWVRRVIITGTTDYRRYQAAMCKQRFSVQFTGLDNTKVRRRRPASESTTGFVTPVEAPAQLRQEMTDLMGFKTATLTAIGFQRQGQWGGETASQKLEHLGLMLGALTAPPDSEVRGYGIPLESLTLGLLVFPAVWDWYLRWRERRRGFFTNWEVDMLRTALALTRKDTGWVRQTPRLAEMLEPVEGLLSAEDITEARADWNAACDRLHSFATARAKEIERVSRVHRDPFEPILPILEADSPLAEYRKITEEILCYMPDERRYPVAASEAVRSFLMLRVGLHSGLRQKNLRQLLICSRDEVPLSERRLTELKRGQLRWNNRSSVWELFIPSAAFKNANSSYFGSKPFQLVLPDLGGLYEAIDAYIRRHRPRLLRQASDPRTFFVKTVKTTSANAAYNQTTFYEAWRLAIQRYGIYNPYTGRGAIEGLLPHGPHNVRDVLATHILKKTGSYEQASYAIQDTPDMVAKHYGRFLPQDKAALAAQVLNKVWEAS